MNGGGWIYRHPGYGKKSFLWALLHGQDWRVTSGVVVLHGVLALLVLAYFLTHQNHFITPEVTIELAGSKSGDGRTPSLAPPQHQANPRTPAPARSARVEAPARAVQLAPAVEAKSEVAPVQSAPIQRQPPPVPAPPVVKEPVKPEPAAEVKPAPVELPLPKLEAPKLKDKDAQTPLVAPPAAAAPITAPALSLPQAAAPAATAATGPSVTGVSSNAPDAAAGGAHAGAQQGAGGATGGVGGAPTLDASYKSAGLNNQKPPYPPLAYRLKLQGTVTLSVEVLEDGAAGAAHVMTSSGYAMLDQSALQTVKTWHFTPARQDGVIHRQVIRIPITFKLIDR